MEECLSKSSAKRHRFGFCRSVIHNDRQPFITDNDSASMGLRNSKSCVVSRFGFCVLLTWPVIQTGGSVQRKKGGAEKNQGVASVVSKITASRPSATDAKP